MILQDNLNAFYEVSKASPGPIPWSVTLNPIDSSQKKSSAANLKINQSKLLIVFAIHGDEIDTLPGILEFISDFKKGKIIYPSSITFILGNPEAAKESTRFIEQDMNRLFVFPVPPSSTKEHLRSEAIFSTFKDYSVLLDLHQTRMKLPHPFFCFAFHKASYLWAKALEGAPVMVTRSPKEAFLPGKKCVDEAFRDLGKPSMTLELGHIGEDLKEKTYKVLKNFVDVSQKVYFKELKIEAVAQKPLDLLQRIAHFNFSDPKMTLKPDLTNFRKISKGEELGKSILSPADGFLLFPKYPKRNDKGEAIPPYDPYLFQVLGSISLDQALKW
jgi:succinylglutamate desuccinylase